MANIGKRLKAAREGVDREKSYPIAEAVKVAGAITPVPGGVGPMTIACLLKNTLTAFHARRG